MKPYKNKWQKKWIKISSVFIALMLGYAIMPVKAMHIMEGFLPPLWSLFWFVAAMPFWIIGIIRIKRLVVEKPEIKPLLALGGAFTFVLSALKLPSVTGSCSHPTGTGLGAILFGPFIMSILGSIVLIFQALLLAHGGLTTLGANSFSMAIVGPFAAFLIWKGLRGRLSDKIVVFLAAAFADLLTYVTTSLQLALAFPDPLGGFAASFVKFGTIFAITQVPLAVSEGILTVLVYQALQSNAEEELAALGLKGA